MGSEDTLRAEERERRVRDEVPLQLTVIRHAEPDWGASTDPGLTERGQRTALQLADHLRERQFAAIVSSPLRRARETAAAIAEVQNIEPVVLDDLAEISVPLIGNISQAEVDAYFRSAAHRPLDQHWEGFPGGESFHDFHKRVTAAILGMLKPYGVHAQQAEGFEIWNAPSRSNMLRLAVVAHGGTNAVMLTHLLGIAPVPWEWIRFETPLAAYSVIGLRPLNDRAHIWSLQQFGRRFEGS
jgi:2,3-bisphosphoglycerate-dependent phosphoglycerate mutase